MQKNNILNNISRFMIALDSAVWAHLHSWMKLMNRTRYELQASVSQRVGGSGNRLAEGARPVNLAPAYVELDKTEHLLQPLCDGCIWWRCFVFVSSPELIAAVGDSVGPSGRRWGTTVFVSLSATFAFECCVWRPVSPSRKFCPVRRRCVLLGVCLPARRGRTSSLGPSTQQLTLVTAVCARSVRVIINTVSCPIHYSHRHEWTCLLHPQNNSLTSVSSAWKSRLRNINTQKFHP